MTNGFILLSRELLKSDVFASQKLLKIWIWCLLKANHKDRTIPLKVGKGERLVKVKRGSFIFGRFKAEEELYIDGSTIYKLMKKLTELDMISIKSNNQYSIVTICKYNTYQDVNSYKVATKEQPSNNQVTTKEQPSNTTKKVNKDKKDKKDNIILDANTHFDFFWNNYNKKVGDKNKCEKIWNNLDLNTQQTILDTLPEFIKQYPDKQYQPYPTTYLNQKRWNDEIIIKTTTNGKQQGITEDEFARVKEFARNMFDKE